MHGVISERRMNIMVRINEEGIQKIDKTIDPLRKRDAKEKYYVVLIEKGLYKALLEVLKMCFPSITCEFDYEIESFDGQQKYIVVELGDYSGHFDNIPSPTIEDILMKLPILFFREEGSTYIFTRGRNELRVKTALENLFVNSCRDEDLIYTMFTLSERYQCILNASYTYFDNINGLEIGEIPLDCTCKLLFSAETDWEIENKISGERECIDPTLNINKPHYSLCFFE